MGRFDRPPGRGGARATRRREGDEAGQALVEFLLIAPLLIALLAGIFEYGWYAHARSVASQASLSATRTAAIEGAITSDATTAATDMLTGGDLPIGGSNANGVGGPNVTYKLCVGPVDPSDCETVVPNAPVAPICAINVPGTQLPAITVTVTYNYKLLFPFLKSPLFLGLGGVIAGPFKATTTMPAEVGWLHGQSGPYVRADGRSIVCP